MHHYGDHEAAWSVGEAPPPVGPRVKPPGGGSVLEAPWSWANAVFNWLAYCTCLVVLIYWWDNVCFVWWYVLNLTLVREVMQHELVTLYRFYSQQHSTTIWTQLTLKLKFKWKTNLYTAIKSEHSDSEALNSDPTLWQKNILTTLKLNRTLAPINS